jgi:tRNA (cmo5U34)-methyltransferase
MGSVGDGIKASSANWTFAGDVAKGFDDHVSKSVPLYNEGHQLICELSDFFISKDSICYELGASTGALTQKLARHNGNKPGAHFIGVDVEPEMIKMADHKAREKGGLKNLEFVTDDIIQMEFKPCDMIVSYYVVQFVRPAVRQQLIDKIYKSLNWGGAFVLFEKVRGPDARFQDIALRLYDEYKIRQGYSADEIVSKSRSLKGVLEPFSSQGNIDLLKRAGFQDVMSIQKYVCFEGFLAIK